MAFIVTIVRKHIIIIIIIIIIIQVNSFLVHSNTESTAKQSITETAQQANTDNKGQ